MKQTIPFHEKYTHQGRFAIDLPDTPTGDGPTRPSMQDIALPRLGLLTDRKAVGDFTDDDGEMAPKVVQSFS